MLRIGICDDEENQLNQTAELMDLYLRSRPGLDAQVETFTSGSALLTRAQNTGGFALYVMDILMPELNGIETSRRLRAMGDGGEIVYLTSSNDFAADSYDVRAFFYLLKPVEERKLFQVLDRAIEKLNQRRSKAVVVSTAEGPRRILLEHIRYVERFGRCVRYHCTDGIAEGPRRILLEHIRYVERFGRCVRYHCTDGIVDSQTIRISFRQMVAPLLSDRRFYLCGASFVLNFQYVTGVNGQTALLDSGQTLSLPRMAAADFKKGWGNYWLEEAEGW